LSGTDLIGGPLTASEERVLAAYEELKALCADEELPPIAAANVRAALALMHNVVNGLALKYEHLSDLGV
jgi:7-keto-8-aminopelargonate synthetase-like enzyme